jgi:hypothetical protein
MQRKATKYSSSKENHSGGLQQIKVPTNVIYIKKSNGI